MTQIAFNAVLDTLSEYFGQKISDLSRSVLWNTIQYWADDEIKAAQKCIESENNAKQFTKLYAWSKYRDRYLAGKGKSETKNETSKRTRFYLVTTCPRCGYGEAQEWGHKFDRFDERLHDKCQPCHKWLYEHGDADATAAQMRTGKYKRRIPANEVKEWVAPPSVCVYPVSLREEIRPVFGNIGKMNNAAISDDGRMHKTTQATEAIETEYAAADLPF